MITRNTLYSSPGGDTTQILMTAKYLKGLGCDVTININDDVIEYSRFDIIHFFNIIRPADIIKHVRLSSIPFVISSIFVDYSEYEKLERKGIIGFINAFFSTGQIEYFKTIARFFKNGEKINSAYYLLNGHSKSVKYIANKASLLLPNSHSEYKRLQAAYHIKTPYKKIVNAADSLFFGQHNNLNDDKFENCVLCIGRIEGRKNQLNLIRAVEGTGIKLVIIGKPSPNHLKYYEECKKIAANYQNIEIINHIDHEQLAGIYAKAKVHALPSWFETTGLSSLEAAAAGCNIVVSKKGDTEEYFGNLAYYCDPGDIVSIKNAVIAAYNAPKVTILRDYVLSNFTWPIAAQQTFDAYKSVIKSL